MVVIFANHSSLPNSLQLYREYLCDIYHNNAYSIYTKPSEIIAQYRPNQPLNLVLVHKAKNELDISHEEQVQHAYRGDVDAIQNQTTVIKMEEIGYNITKETPAHFVLIEGAPGVGKSTLCWQLCRLWSEDKLRHKWDLMVLVEIRDETTQKARNVYDLLYYPDDSVRKSIAQEVEKREGEGLLLIFDGYDELSSNQHSDPSVLQKIITNRFLHKTTVVVTSRQIATKNLPSQFIQNLDQHIVINGFNKSDIQQYISLACGNNMHLFNDFLSYVYSQPFVFSLMYNPLHCTIVTEVYIQCWQDGRKGFAPNTLTELYTAFVLNLLRRNLPDQSDIEKLTDLPTDVLNILLNLSKLAEEGLRKKTFVYKRVPHNTFGLMVSVRKLYDIRAKRSAYMFLHLTLQEYLAAFYWSYQPRNELIDDLFFNKFRQNPIKFYGNEVEHTDTDRLPFTLFLAGLTKLDSWPLDLMLNNSHGYLARLYCQLLFEAQNSEIVTQLFSHRRVVIHMHVLMRSLFSIGYCIANSDSTTSWFLNIDMSYLQLLMDSLKYCNIKVPGPSAVNLSIVSFSKAFPDNFLRVYPFTSGELYIKNHLINIQTDEQAFLLQNLSYNLVPNFNLSSYVSSLFMESFLFDIQLNYSSVFDILRVDQGLAKSKFELSTFMQ